MNDALALFRQSASAIVIPSEGSQDTIQKILAARLATCIDELADDYIRCSGDFHPRTCTVVARTSLEAFFRLQATLQSVDCAVSIAYASAEEDLTRVRNLHAIDPTHPDSAQKVISSLEEEVSALKGLLGGSPRKKLTIFDIVKASNFIGFYRSHYFNLSQYIHSSYSTSRVSTETEVTITKIANESVLLSLCVSSETLAAFFSHTNLAEIQRLARKFWSDRNTA